MELPIFVMNMEVTHVEWNKEISRNPSACFYRNLIQLFTVGDAYGLSDTNLIQ